MDSFYYIYVRDEDGTNYLERIIDVEGEETAVYSSARHDAMRFDKETDAYDLAAKLNMQPSSNWIRGPFRVGVL